ncbi:hypothetical protein FGK63_02175 [Ruegeria sediminis]|uniref:Outer membrane protein beta-barrel domain-containing protein n=1 Tax=Ruegeria sediminis TaxID=2583820 RepID=A0ABY2X4B8_9RHOB|nr:hypothetical protein [Ruegeria sediminis]TMV09900.1 hypothetical protein FGK63_02175 [Ruegeria sediminis]
MRRTTRILLLPVVAALTHAPGQTLADDATYGFEVAEHGPHIIEVFLGGTHADHHGSSETVFSAGVQYRYAITHRVSFGVLAEYANEPLDAWIVGAPVVFNLGETNWQLTAMPGVEIEDSEEEFLFRAGVGYEFELTDYTLKPEVNVDWVDGDTAIVAGVSVGFRF